MKLGNHHRRKGAGRRRWLGPLVFLGVVLAAAGPAPAQTIESLMRALQQRHLALEHRRQIEHDLRAEMVRNLVDEAGDSGIFSETIEDLMESDLPDSPDSPVFDPPARSEFESGEDGDEAWEAAVNTAATTFAQAVSQFANDERDYAGDFNQAMEDRNGKVHAYKFFVNDFWYDEILDQFESADPYDQIPFYPWGGDFLMGWIREDIEWFQEVAGAPVTQDMVDRYFGLNGVPWEGFSGDTDALLQWLFDTGGEDLDYTPEPIEWEHGLDAQPEDGALDDKSITEILDVLNQMSFEFDRIKKRYVHGASAAMEPGDKLGGYPELFDDLSLPSVGRVNLSNYPVKIRELASGILKLKMLIWPMKSGWNSWASLDSGAFWEALGVENADTETPIALTVPVTSGQHGRLGVGVSHLRYSASRAVRFGTEIWWETFDGAAPSGMLDGYEVSGSDLQGRISLLQKDWWKPREFAGQTETPVSWRVVDTVDGGSGTSQAAFTLDSNLGEGADFCYYGSEGDRTASEASVPGLIHAGVFTEATEDALAAAYAELQNVYDIFIHKGYGFNNVENLGTRKVTWGNAKSELESIPGNADVIYEYVDYEDPDFFWWPFGGRVTYGGSYKDYIHQDLIDDQYVDDARWDVSGWTRVACWTGEFEDDPEPDEFDAFTRFGGPGYLGTGLGREKIVIPLGRGNQAPYRDGALVIRGRMMGDGHRDWSHHSHLEFVGVRSDFEWEWFDTPGEEGFPDLLEGATPDDAWNSDTWWRRNPQVLSDWRVPRVRQIKGRDCLVEFTHLSDFVQVLNLYQVEADGSKGKQIDSIQIRNPDDLGGDTVPAHGNHDRLEVTSSSRWGTAIFSVETGNWSLENGVLKQTAEETESAEVGNENIVEVKIETYLDDELVGRTETTFHDDFGKYQERPVVTRAIRKGIGDAGTRTVTYTWIDEAEEEEEDLPPDRRKFRVEKVATSGANWAGHGDVAEFDTYGNVTRSTSKLANLRRETLLTLDGNTATTEEKLDGKAFPSTVATYTEGLRTIDSETDGLTTTMRLAAGDATARPWSLASLHNPDGTGTVASAVVVDDGDGETLKTTVESGMTAGPVVTSGTKTETRVGRDGRFHERVTRDIESDLVLDKLTAPSHDAGTAQPKQLVSLDGSREKFEYDPLGRVTKHTDPLGLVTETGYDTQGRIAWTQRGNVRVTPAYKGFTRTDTVSGGGRSFSNDTTVDTFGQVRSAGSGFGEGSQTSVEPGGAGWSSSGNVGERSTGSSAFLDGLPWQVDSGFGQNGARIDYAVEDYAGQTHLVVTATMLDDTDNLTGVTHKTWYDHLGRVRKVETPHPDGNGTVATTIEYDTANRTVTTTPPAPSPQQVVKVLEDGKTTEITEGTREMKIVQAIEGGMIKETTSLRDDASNGGAFRVVSESKATPNGFQSFRTPWELAALQTTTTRAPPRNGIQTTKVKGPFGASRTTEISDEGRMIRTDGAALGGGYTSEFSADSYGMPLHGDLRHSAYEGTRSAHFDPETGRVVSINGWGEHRTFEYSHPEEGLRIEVTDEHVVEDGNKVTATQISAAGDFEAWSGHGGFDHEATTAYNGTTRTVTLDPEAGGGTVFTMGPGGGTVDKDVDGGIGDLQYTLHPDGSIATVLDGRGLSKTFTWEDGLMKGWTYAGNDGAGSRSVAIDYHDVGVPKSIADESGTRTITYDRLRRKDEDYGGAGALSGYSIKRFHTDLNLERVLVQKGNEVIHWVGYGYNGFNQLGAVESPGLSVSYFAYETGTGAPEKFDRNGLRTVRRYDERMRLEAETTGEDWEFTRTFTSRSQIESESLNGTALWTMGYGENGELESCSGPNGSYGYGFDAIGNRNGWGFGPGNEITWRSHALLRFLPVKGSVHPLASVELELATVRDAATLEWIWGSPAALATDAAGRFEHVEWPVGNEREFGVRVRGRITGGGYQGADRIAEEERTVFLPPVDFNPVYDGAGNLDHDWRFDYQWNGSNQLTHFHTITNQVADQYEVDMVYDAEGRRVRKTVTKNGELEIDTRFLYDGWNLLAEIVVETDLGTGAQTSWERFYTWGLDVSDSMGGAGGIGGLLSIYDGRTKSLLLPVYDGRGNIKALIDDRTRRTVARYEYDPFGRLLRAEGPAAESNPFRWQTKYRDAETGFYYFGYRYYEPSSARWISRDPIGEAGGINLYHYCHNDPINKYDYLGLDVRSIGKTGLVDVTVGPYRPEYRRYKFVTEVLSTRTYTRFGVGTSRGYSYQGTDSVTKVVGVIEASVVFSARQLSDPEKYSELEKIFREIAASELDSNQKIQSAETVKFVTELWPMTRGFNQMFWEGKGIEGASNVVIDGALIYVGGNWITKGKGAVSVALRSGGVSGGHGAFASTSEVVFDRIEFGEDYEGTWQSDLGYIGKRTSIETGMGLGLGYIGGRFAFSRVPESVNPSTIRFTQSSVGNTINTPNGTRPLRRLVKDLTSGRVSADDLPPIRVFEKNGQIFTLDNRRLKAFQVAGKPINTVQATAEEIAAEAWKFTTKNGGTSVRVRGGGL